MDKKEIPVSGHCQLSKFKRQIKKEIETILLNLTEINAEDHRFTSVTYDLIMKEYLYLRFGFCRFSEFKKHINKGIETILQKLTELKAENHKITSVSYELMIEVK